MSIFLNRLLFILVFTFLSGIIIISILFPIFTASEVIIPFSITPFNICEKNPLLWHYMKVFYIIFLLFTLIIISNILYSIFYKLFKKDSIKKSVPNLNENQLNVFIGNSSSTNEERYITEKGLYQNILITGTIGSGKTSSCMYPITKQLIEYKCNDLDSKVGILVLDVKGNYYKQVLEYAKNCNREGDVIVIQLGGKIRYNPLHKPNLKPTVLANRLKTILTLFSPNNSESYWLDKSETVLMECIKLCRLYNNGYVTFSELHKLVNLPNYYLDKICSLKKIFQSGTLTKEQVYDLSSSLEFFEKEFHCLDSRTLSILKSEINRITGPFISDYQVLNTFSPELDDLNFYGFSELINSGKIVILNMNIAEYKNLSKLIAAYLKLDFQSEVMSSLSKGIPKRITAFISDEFHEYVTVSDADFFAQSREARCINIVATQSYTSLLNTLKEQSCVKAIVQNLINKLWFRTDDIFTIEDAQKQIGKEDKQKTSNTISENARETNFNYFTNTLNSQNSSISESINTYTQTDFIYDTNFFTQHLETFSCIAFLSDGNKIQTPEKINLTPYFISNPNHTNLPPKSKYSII